MTWAERVGDLAKEIALVLVNLARIFTLFARIATEKIDNFVTSLAEKGEEGIRPSDTPRTTWTALPAAVLWGASAVALRAVSIITVFARQLTSTVDEFFRVLAEG